MATTKEIKKELSGLIKRGDFKEISQWLDSYPRGKIIKVLFSLLLASDELVRWRSVTVLGIVIENLALQDISRARVFLRRCMWMLTDESGGIGWGVPEVMGEVLSRSEVLAREFSSILVSYVIEEEDRPDNFLEYIPLRRGAWWGVARMSQGVPLVVKKWAPFLVRCMEKEEDAHILAYALLCLRELSHPFPLDRFVKDGREVRIYWNFRLSIITLSSLAKRGV